MDDPCEKCLIAINCSNACTEIMEYYNYLSKKTRANLEATPGITEEDLEEFEVLERRGKALVEWWRITEGIRD